MTADLDASLASWPDLAARHPCSGLLLGNGASRAIWRPFSYFSLFEIAQRVRNKPLGVSDQALFKSLGSELFEPVLSALNTTVRVNAALAISSSAPLNRYYSIKEALIHAIRSVHIPRKLLPDTTLAAINAELRNYRNVFSGNYDLLCHWAMSHDPQGFESLFDEEGHFDVSRPRGDGTRLHYLHGGLHLLRTDDGGTRLRAASGSQLLDGFAINTPGDVPLFVNECTREHKLKAIRSSDYLTWSYTALASHCEGLCLFGHHLDRADHHLLHAIQQARPPYLAIAILPVSEAAIISQKQHFTRIFAETPEISLHFFDASSHPLGRADLNVPAPAAITRRRR